MAASRLMCIIDDEADYRFLLQQLFSRYLPTYSVRFFASGNVFLEELPQIKPIPGLILLDRHMPQLDGYQLLVHLKENPAYHQIPVVMMSAHASSFEIDECYRAGANSFLSKQIDFESLKKNMSVICQYWLELNQVVVRDEVLNE